MKFDIKQPCKSCPYRKDAPEKMWHKSEFENLLMQDTNEYGGSTFGCHEFRKMPETEHRPCAGWLLDQRKRGTPSIMLRLMLIRSEEAAKCYENLTAGDAVLYQSIKSMCRANGVR